MTPRASTIVWGSTIVLVALLFLLGPLIQVADLRLDPAAVVVWTIGGIGALLVLGAIAAAIVSALRRSEPDAAERDTRPSSSDSLLG